MWKVHERKDVAKVVTKLPPQVLAKYEFWKSVVETTGPDSLQALRGLRDEALSGSWAGYRSSRLNLHWRVIYKVHRDEIEVTVERITPHDYRK
jgi:addiction module RelE/StbE family toxin